MSDMNYSLCTTYPLRNKPDKMMFFRIMDYNIYNKEYIPILNTEWSNDGEPKIIGSNPIEVKKDITHLRKWKYSEYEEGKTISYHEEGSVFEVIYLSELNGVSINETEKIRKILLNGFRLPEYTASELLIIIGEEASKYKAIHCLKGKLKYNREGLFHFSDNITDMLHTTHFLNEYEISKLDVVNTENIDIKQANGSRYPTRFFYKYSELSVSTGVFNLFAVEEYIPQFILKYLRKNKELSGLNNVDLRSIAETVRDILSQKTDIEEYFSVTGYQYEQVFEEMSLHNASIIKGLFSRDEKDELIRNYLFMSDDIKARCLDIARDEWIKEQNDVKNQILLEINKLNSSSEEMKKRVDDQLGKWQELYDKNTALKKDISLNEEKLKNLEQDIQNELEKFENNIVYSTALVKAIEKVTNEKNISEKNKGTTSSVDHSLYISINSFEAEKEKECINGKESFEDCLSENLENLGYSSANAVEIAQLISFCCCNKLPLIVPYSGEELANAVSATFGRVYTAFLDVPSGYSNTKEMIKSIQLAMSEESVNVFYLTGVFDGYSQGIFNTLLHLYRRIRANTLFIISLDGIEPDMIPKSVWDNAMFLDDDYAWRFVEDTSLSIYDFETYLKSTYSEKSIKAEMKVLKPIVNLMGRRNAAKVAKYMVETKSELFKSGILLQQLMISTDAKEEMKEYIEGSSISEKAREFAEKYMR